MDFFLWVWFLGEILVRGFGSWGVRKLGIVDGGMFFEDRVGRLCLFWLFKFFEVVFVFLVF